MNELVHIKIKDDPRIIPANRWDLVHASQYFRAMFLAENDHNTSMTVDLDLQGIIPYEVLESVIFYTTSKSILATKSTIGQLILAADFFLIDELKDALSRLITNDHGKQIIDATNVLKYWKKLENDSRLIKSLDTFIEIHFESIIYEASFVELNVDQLINIISRDTLRISTEKVVFYAIKMWVNYAYSDRNQEFIRLLGCVRYDTQVEDEFLDTEIISYCTCVAAEDYVAQYKALRGERDLVVGINMKQRCSNVYVVASSDEEGTSSDFDSSTDMEEDSWMTHSMDDDLTMETEEDSDLITDEGDSSSSNTFDDDNDEEDDDWGPADDYDDMPTFMNRFYNGMIGRSNYVQLFFR